MKYHTTLTAKAEILKPNSEEFKAVATSLQDRYGFDLKPQMDLLYVRSCLVSAGENVGVNDNDDIFTREEAWAARHTPVLKPFNWQHQDTDIVGVMYTVQARSIDGDILDINDETPPDCDFDLYVEAAIFRLIHEDRAAEIEARANSGSLFVSMEAWFDDYSYGLFGQSDGTLHKTVSRNKSTSFLDKHLRANSGTGVYRDPESDQDMRIGRVLRSITFGGCGFVDSPANKRSTIEIAEQMSSVAEHDIELQIEKLLKKVLESQVEDLTEETVMNTQASSQGASPEEITAAVNDSLDAREKAAAQVREQEILQTRATDAETRSEELQSQVVELTEAKETKEAQVEALELQMTEYSDAVDGLVQDNATAGATNSTPAEIAAIDGATDAFSAKIAWIKKSMASLTVRATRADELETQLAQAESVVREQEVRHMLSNNFSTEAVEVMVSRAASLDEESYQAWRDEKELMILEMTTASPDGDADENKKKKLPPFLKKGKEGKDAKAGNPFEALLAQRRIENGTMADANMDLLINHPGGEGVNSGVTPASPGLSTPRHKIAGSADDNPTKILEDAQEVGGVTLAGSQASDDGVGISPFRVLANAVTGVQKEEEVQTEKPGFDPIS